MGLRWVYVLVAVLVGLVPHAGIMPTTEPTVPVVDHVVLISVDGLNPEAITRLGRGGTPTLHLLMVEGASTLDARTTYESTQTLPNHTSMVTGRPVTAVGGHGITFNEDDGSTVRAHAGSYVASAFDVVHDNGGVTALYSGKDKLDLLDRSWDGAHGAIDRIAPPDGRDKIDAYLRAASEDLTDALVTALATAPPDLAMIHLRGPDGVGHARGYMSDAYLDEVSNTDRLIGRLLDTIADDAALAESTVVVLTTDHGGRGFSHADATRAVNYTIPFFVWGPGVDAGADLYALNRDRAAPGTSRPNYDEVPQPIRNSEAANLVTELLGLGAVPDSRINADQTLDVG
jgi:predicted AlkP superfamily pyrophosphatase or phosphodiesterase